MGKETGISWCHSSFNLWWGCVEVSPACDHCYAARDAKRYGFSVWGARAPRRFFKPEHRRQPLQWHAAAEAAQEQRRVFCGSFMDIGEVHPVPETAALMAEERRALFCDIIPATPWLTWLLLTKRPWNLAELVPSEWQVRGWPRNVWPGTTAEDQSWYDRRVDALVRCNATRRFVSYEPALGFVNFRLGSTPIDWIISGGESGGGHRTDNEDYHREARDQCLEHGRAYWFKQHGAFHPKLLGDELDGRQHHDVPDLVAA